MAQFDILPLTLQIYSLQISGVMRLIEVKIAVKPVVGALEGLYKMNLLVNVALISLLIAFPVFWVRCRLAAKTWLFNRQPGCKGFLQVLPTCKCIM